MKISSFTETFVDYKKRGVLIGFPTCNGKCWKDLGMDTSICQNEILKENLIEIPLGTLLDKIKENIESGYAEAIILGGLEPLEDIDNLLSIVDFISNTSEDTDIVIYTGYYKEEIQAQLKEIKGYARNNKVIVKFGRFIPNANYKYDEILGVTLASDNQYAEVI